MFNVAYLAGTVFERSTDMRTGDLMYPRILQYSRRRGIGWLNWKLETEVLFTDYFAIKSAVLGEFNSVRPPIYFDDRLVNFMLLLSYIAGILIKNQRNFQTLL
jgi:hypothetical protein